MAGRWVPQVAETEVVPAGKWWPMGARELSPSGVLADGQCTRSVVDELVHVLHRSTERSCGCSRLVASDRLWDTRPAEWDRF